MLSVSVPEPPLTVRGPAMLTRLRSPGVTEIAVLPVPTSIAVAVEVNSTSTGVPWSSVSRVTPPAIPE